MELQEAKVISGYAKPDAPPRAQPIEKAIDSLSNYLDGALRPTTKMADIMKWEQAVGYFERELRILWERAVEEAVAPVIKRFRNKVETKALSRNLR